MNNPETIKVTCLSLEPAMAYAIAYLGKNIENRSWRADYTGPLYIHASKTKTNHTLYQDFITSLGLHCPGFEDTPKGCLLCRVWVEGVATARAYGNQPSRWGIAGQYWWHIKDPELFTKPIPLKGQLGLFKVDLPISALDFVGISDKKHLIYK
jgi:hypothetical protein